MPPDRRQWRFILAGVLLACLPALLLILWWAAIRTQSPGRILGGYLLILIFCGVGAGLCARHFYRRYVLACARLAEAVDLHAAGNPVRVLDAESGPRELRALAAAIKRQAAAYRAVIEDTEARITAARRDSEQDRNRLAALLADLQQGVLVLNDEGRILLYNASARDLLGGFRSDGAGGYVGLGRQIAGLIDAALIQHVRDCANAGLRQGLPPRPIIFTSSTASGRLLRVRATPVIESGDDTAQAAAQLRGFVMVAEDLTRSAEQAAQRERITQQMVQAQRAGLYGMRLTAERAQGAAIDPAVGAALGELQHEAQRLSDLLAATLREHAELWRANWMLDEMRGVDLLAAAQRRIEARTGVATRLLPVDEAINDVMLRVDSFTMIQALSFLALRVSEACDAREISLQLDRVEAPAQAVIILQWSGTALSTESAMGWELEPMTLGGESSPLSVREVMAWHAAELRFGRERASTRSSFRIQMPIALTDLAQREATDSTSHGRPEFFDFDLPGVAEASSEDFDAMPLRSLACTVFDTETTGLDPRGGDEIIQIGALRILNSRLLRNEIFDQLIDPQRDIPPESLRIHGITREATRGQPTLAQVLPRFAAFARDTVLVGHNIAFDMRFLKIKEAVTGVRFAQPMLDTLLLSAVLHPHQDSHRLEDIAERLGVGIVDRHDALGDARVTAEIFLRMLPLLAAQGIHTLGEARAASEKTYYARIQY